MLQALGKNIEFLRKHIRLAIPVPVKSEKYLGGQDGDMEVYFYSIFYLLFRKREALSLPCRNEVFEIQIKHARLKKVLDLGNDFQKQKLEFEKSSWVSAWYICP